jgi:hypothetical protein
MSSQIEVPLNITSVSKYLKEEQEFLKGFIGKLEQIDSGKLTEKRAELVKKLVEQLPLEIDKIFPMKTPEKQIQALLLIAKELDEVFSKNKLKQLGIQNKWIPLDDGYLGSFVDEKQEIAIILYLITLIYQTLALKFVQTSPEYRYYFISALSSLEGSIAFLEKLDPDEEHAAYPFYQTLLLRKLEIEAEITKTEAFIARKKGDFESASKYFAGAASYRFDMMNYNLSPDSDNQVKIYASTELGMACLYLSRWYENTNETEQSYYYVLKARSYFENAAKLSENNTDLLESANKRLELVNPYIERIKTSLENIEKTIETIPDPQPLTSQIEITPLFYPGDKEKGLLRTCSNCHKRIIWADKCSECNKKIIPFE